MVHFDGHVWALPTTTDTICLLWNKTAFRKAGLDPDRPPQNLDELEEYAAKLTVRGPKGVIEQMGFLPWLPWDNTFMWGVLFGGQWYSEQDKRVECGEDPAIIASLAWQQSFTLDPNAKEQLPYAMDPERIAAFNKGIGDYMSANNPFYSGKVAMISEGEWQVTFIPKYAPGLDWGVAPLPQPKGVAPIAYGPTCVADVVPATARHPEAAKRFLRWFYSPRPDVGFSPASDYNFAIHNIPPRPAEALQERFISNPKFKVFVDQLLTKPVSLYPVLPVTQYLTDTIEREREMVTFRKKTPKEGAMTVQTLVNRELDRVRELLKRRQS
jgi:multiple sugar transport system substrate-binding protein